KPPPLAWLAVIARRRFARFLEKSGASAARESAWDERSEEDQALDAPAAGRNPYLLLEDRRCCEQVMRELALVAEERQRQALIAFFLHQEPLKNIAAELQTPLSTITTWTHRFRSRLKAILHGEGAT